MFKVNNKDNTFTPFSSVSIVDFEQVNAGWVPSLQDVDRFLILHTSPI